jgi:hypothetical protein
MNHQEQHNIMRQRHDVSPHATDVASACVEVVRYAVVRAKSLASHALPATVHPRQLATLPRRTRWLARFADLRFALLHHRTLLEALAEIYDLMDAVHNAADVPTLRSSPQFWSSDRMRSQLLKYDAAWPASCRPLRGPSLTAIFDAFSAHRANQSPQTAQPPGP